jgi:hypothetical protein
MLQQALVSSTQEPQENEIQSSQQPQHETISDDKNDSRSQTYYSCSNGSHTVDDNDFAQISINQQSRSFQNIFTNQPTIQNFPQLETSYLNLLRWDELDAEIQSFTAILEIGNSTLIPQVIDSNWSLACCNEYKLDCTEGLIGMYSRIQKVILASQFEAEVASK